MILDPELDHDMPSIVEEIKGTSLMHNMVADKCSESSNNYKVAYENMLVKDSTDWKAIENDEFVELYFKLNLRLPLFIK